MSLKKRVVRAAPSLKNTQLSPSLVFGIAGIIIFLLTYLLSKIFLSAFTVLFLIIPVCSLLSIFFLRQLPGSLLACQTVLLCLACVSFHFIKPGLHQSGFKDLISLQQFADKISEQKIVMDNSNLLKPSYDKYYATLKPSFFKERLKTLMQFLKLAQNDIWQSSNFIEMLNKVLEAFKKADLPKSDYVSKVMLSESSKVIVFGDLMGTFDSFVRDLKKLKDLDIMGDDFKLKKPSDFIVLTGDAVSRSPYQLELLSILFKVMLANPNQFFYIKGNHETDNHWKEYSLKSELVLRLGIFLAEREVATIEDNISLLFSMLPTGLYMGIPNTNPVQFIRICHLGAERSPLFIPESENKLYKFLTTPQKDLGQVETIAFNQIRDEDSMKNIPILSIIKAEKKRETYQDMDGLRQLPSENGITAWTVLSCPSEVFQKGLKFFYDAFVVLSFGKNAEKDSKITLYKQDIRAKTGFTTREANLVSGSESSENQQKTEQATGVGASPVNPQTQSPTQEQDKKSSITNNLQVSLESAESDETNIAEAPEVDPKSQPNPHNEQVLQSSTIENKNKKSKPQTQDFPKPASRALVPAGQDVSAAPLHDKKQEFAQ